MNDLISIIVPTKNAEKTILRTLQSLSKQTYKNIEIINIDCSSDSTKSIVKKFSNKDKRVKCIDSPVVGLAKQRNYGVEIASGEFVIFVDGDDAASPHFVDNLYSEIKKTNSDIVCTNFVHINSETNEILDKKDSNSSIILSGIEACFQLETTRNTQLTLCQGKLLRRTFLQKFKINEKVLNEDEATTYLWYLNSTKICIMDSQDYLYYITPNSLSSLHNKNLEIKVPQLIWSYEQRYLAYKSTNDRKLTFLGWKRLIDVSLQYAYVFKKNNNKSLKKLMKSYYKNYRNFHYLVSHFCTYLKLFLKYIRVIV